MREGGCGCGGGGAPRTRSPSLFGVGPRGKAPCGCEDESETALPRAAAFEQLLAMPPEEHVDAAAEAIAARSEWRSGAVVRADMANPARAAMIIPRSDGFEEEQRILRPGASEILALVRHYGSSIGLQGPPGTSAVMSRQDAELVTVNATPVSLINYDMQDDSKVKARAFVMATGTNDGTTGRWWEIQMTFRRASGGGAVQSGASVVNGGQEGADAANFAATIAANAAGGIELQITGSTNEVNWVGALLIEEESLDCFCGYRTITKGGAQLSSSLVAGQPCRSIQRGSSFYSRYFRLDVPVGTTITIDMQSGVFDTYLYLLKGTSKNGALLAFNDDHFPGTNSQIVYTTSANDGTQFTIDCTSFSASATGAFTVQVT